MSAETKSKQKPPVAEIREGLVRIAIWEREGDSGFYYKAGKPELSYEKDGEFKESSSYDEFELEALALAALRARKEIRHQRKISRTNQQPLREDAGE